MRYLMILAVLTLCGCGQKGDLYLPQDTSQSDAAMSTTQGQPRG
ncbi:LPS translocon maturation chaperone LptM [Pseudomonas sp. HK3]